MPSLGPVAVPHRGFSRRRVVDLSMLLPGPYATQLLSDMGMKVARVELPHFPDMMRSAAPFKGKVGSSYWWVNRGKTEHFIDYRKPEGLKKVRKMIAAADVLVEGFRPGTMEKSGLGYAECRKLNPQLVYCSLSGYDAAGPWARKAGHDINFQAVAGMLGLAEQPSVPQAFVGDLAGSLSAVAGILAALLEGKGRHVRVSLTDAAHALLPVPLGELAAGADPSVIPRWWKGDHPFYRLYATSDGRRVAVGALERNFATALLDSLGLGALKPLLSDLAANATELSGALERAFGELTFAEWEARLEALDCCATPVYRLGEAAALLKPKRLPARRPIP